MQRSGTTLKYPNANDLGTKKPVPIQSHALDKGRVGAQQSSLVLDGHSLASDYTNITQQLREKQKHLVVTRH